MYAAVSGVDESEHLLLNTYFEWTHPTDDKKFSDRWVKVPRGEKPFRYAASTARKEILSRHHVETTNASRDVVSSQEATKVEEGATSAPSWSAGMPRSSSETFSVMTWNILAHCYTSERKKARGEYAMVEDVEESLPWEKRLPRLIQEISDCDADVVCLQEVMFDVYQNDLEPLFFSLGYYGLMQDDKKRAPLHPVGNAIFWKMSVFEETPAWESHRSRTMVAILKFRDRWELHQDDDDLSESDLRDSSNAKVEEQSKNVAIINCHLEGDPDWVAVRVRQLSSAFKQLSASNIPHQGVICCGDFNCDLGTSASSHYCALGMVPEGLPEWGVVDKDCQTIGPHGYNFTAAYPFVLENFSFAAQGRRDGPGGMVDQFWYTSESLMNLGYRDLFFNDSQRLAMRATSSIRVDNPSDHLPLAVCFAWKKQNSSKDLGAAAKNLVLSSQGGSALAADSLKTLDPTALEDPLAFAHELLDAACGLSKEEKDGWRNVFGPLASDKFVFNNNLTPQKPTKDQLETLKLHREQREALLKRVDADTKQILDQVCLLEKRAKKKIQQELAKKLRKEKEQEKKQAQAQAATGYPTPAS